jgi:hypothetical protein
MLKALAELGFSEEYDKGVFKCVRDPKLQRRAWSTSRAGVKTRPGEDFPQLTAITKGVI